MFFSGVADLLAGAGAFRCSPWCGSSAPSGAGMLLRGVSAGLRLAPGAHSRRRLPYLQECAAGRTEDQRRTSIQVSTYLT